MKRLTRRIFNNAAILKEANGVDDFLEMSRIRQKALGRLADYEDTALEPEEITAIKHALAEKSLAEIEEFERRQSEVELITETELKRCPFCGSDATEYKQLEHDGQTWNAIKCVKCGATGPDYVDGLERKELAATAWNIRVSEQLKED